MATLYDTYKQPGPKPKRKPIIVTNPNDPRLKAYNDSLSTYNNLEQGYKESVKLLNSSKTRDEYVDRNKAMLKRLPVNGKLLTETPLQPLSGKIFSNGVSQKISRGWKATKPVQPVVYQKPQSVEQPEKIFPAPVAGQSRPARITVPQQSVIPEPDGVPVYGPANSTIGYNVNGKFAPYQGVNQRGTVNNPDTDLMNNSAELKKYLSLKGIQYENGGSMGTLYTAYRKNKLAGGGSMYDSSIETEIPPIIGGGSRSYLPISGGVSNGTGTGAAPLGAQGTLGTTASRAGNKINWGSVAGGVAGIANEVIDSTGPGDPLTGRKSVGSYIAKGAISGAATGTSILPGWGTLIGAVVGGAAGWISGGAKKSKARKAMGNEINANRTAAINYSSSLAARDKTLYEGYKGADYYGKYGGKMTKFGMGGITEMSTPLATMYMNGGRAKSLSSDNAELVGNSHKQGGIYIPEMNAEVEGGETTVGDYVFSKKLGFADLHKPIAKAKGKIEAKPATKERIYSLKRLKDEEQNMVFAQEFLKSKLKIA